MDSDILLLQSVHIQIQKKIDIIVLMIIHAYKILHKAFTLKNS